MGLLYLYGVKLLKVPVFNYQAVTTYEEMDVKLHAFITLGLYGKEWSVLVFQSLFTQEQMPRYPPNKRFSVHQRRVGHIGDKENTSYTCRESNPRRPARSQ